MKSTVTAALSLAFELFLGSGLAQAQPVITVSEQYRAIHSTHIEKISPGQSIALDLRTTAYQDQFTLLVADVGRNIDLIVIDGNDRKKDTPNPKPLLSRRLVSGEAIKLPIIKDDEGIIVLLVNRGIYAESISARVDRHGTRPEQIRSRLRDWIAIPIQAIDTFFHLPSIHITVQPCGSRNAFSTPNIVICTELFADLTERQLVRALYPILLHELSHSILRIWELPGYDNEDIADEFAAVFSNITDKKSLPEFISFLESRNSVSEAAFQLNQGSRHTISIQRARNMARIALNPSETTTRWFKLLQPYRRQ